MDAIINSDQSVQFRSGNVTPPAGAIVVPVPDHLMDRLTDLVWTGSELRLRSSVASWYIDPLGNKSAVRRSPEDQAVTCAFDTVLVRDGAVWRARTGAESLSAEKDRLKVTIDREAERVRLAVITPGAGQAMVYQRKADEARSYLAASDPDPDDYPILQASVGIEASTIGEVADLVMTREREWVVVSAAIEAVRLGAKAAVDLAETIEAANAAASDVVWPAHYL